MPIPPVSGQVEITTVVDWAVEAEEAGWDAFSVWDHLLMWYPEDHEVFDPWIVRAAIAVKTKSIKIASNITPLARRRPWKVARESVSLDHLSNGRVIMGVGLGAPPEEFDAFGEEANPKIRAEKLDEAMEILTGLWSGEPVSFKGKHFNLKEVTFRPRPVQKPRIPIWVGGAWPNKNPFRRAARYDGVVPTREWPDFLSPEDLREVLTLIEGYRGNLKDFDAAVFGQTTGVDKTEDRLTIESWIESGATWWFEMINGWRAKPKELLERIRNGPPEV
ncbi:MAG: LLM class flavin-dependent oxidoreductase [Candidatus Thorarchaeota archaeon]|nr:MAG: LLM class flavin-dependent oxidoreductase [Candidatus Thorarchaeota archaeon]